MTICQTVYQPHVDQGDETILTPDLMLTAMDVGVTDRGFVPISIERLSTRVAIPAVITAQDAAPALAVIASSGGALISVGAVHRFQPSMMGSNAGAALAAQAGNTVLSRSAARLESILAQAGEVTLEQQIGDGPDQGPVQSWPISDLLDRTAADLAPGHIRFFSCGAFSALAAGQWRTIRLCRGDSEPLYHAYQILALGD